MRHDAMQWRESGACAAADPDLFFPFATGIEGARQAEKARRVCVVCPVRRPCLQFAVDHHEAHGIWGGTTPEERARERVSQLKAERSAARPGHGAAPGAAA